MTISKRKNRLQQIGVASDCYFFILLIQTWENQGTFRQVLFFIISSDSFLSDFTFATFLIKKSRGGDCNVKVSNTTYNVVTVCKIDLCWRCKTFIDSQPNWHTQSIHNPIGFYLNHSIGNDGLWMILGNFITWKLILKKKSQTCDIP